MKNIDLHLDKKSQLLHDIDLEEEDLRYYTHYAEAKKKRKPGFWLISILLIPLVTFISYFIITYTQDEVTPKENVRKIAGTAITQTTRIVNPPKKEKRYVSALIMGIDTRGVTFNGEEYKVKKWDGTRKMDVIMQILYDREERRLIFISIPRDTSLNTVEECMHQEREGQKYINRFYDMAEKNKCPFTGVEAMKKYVTYITGYDIDYYTVITLDSFVDLINIVGETNNGKKGIWIDIPRNIYDFCPNDWYGYDSVYFEKGRQFLTSKRALCYVRVRKSSSDFDRNRRQQQVVKEVMRLISESNTLSDPAQLFKIYNSQKKKIQMNDMSITDITLGLEVLNEADLTNIQRIVLDHEFGGTNSLLTKPRYSPPGTHARGGGYYLIPTAWDKECCRQDEWRLVREYLQKVVEDPNAKNEVASMFAYVNKYQGNKKAVFDNASYQEFKRKANDDFIYFDESKYAMPMLSEGPDIQIFDFSKGKKTATAAKLAEISGGKVYSANQAPFKPINNEEISIVIRVN